MKSPFLYQPNCVFLEPVSFAKNLSILIQGSSDPVIRANGSTNFLCSNCKECIIVERADKGEFWDVVFRCYSCNELSAGPVRPPGTPLPSPHMVLDAKSYLIKGPLLTNGTVVMVGAATARRRDIETGKQIRALSRSNYSQLNSEMLLDVVASAKNLLGDDYDSLHAQYRRGQDHIQTPPNNRHRLILLIERVQASIDSLTRNEAVDLLSICELRNVLILLQSWQDDPAWHSIQTSLKDSNNYIHSLLTLTAASYYTDLKLGIGIDVEVIPGQRAADLCIFVDAHSRIKVEVKTKKALIEPSGQITRRKARRAIEEALSSAGTTVGGQLSPEHPGFLLLSGIRLSSPQETELCDSARQIMRERGSRYQHIMGIGLLSFGNLDELVRNSEEVSLTATMFHQFHHIPNPQYSGSVPQLFIEESNTPN